MKTELHLAQEFGAYLADGERAADFRTREIEPHLGFSGEIIFDFTGIRTANSAFMNALLSKVIEHHGERILDFLTFKGCNRSVQALVESAIDLGMLKFGEHARA